MRSYDYQTYLAKVKDLVKEPLPRDMLESVATMDEAFDDMVNVVTRPDRATRLPSWKILSNMIYGFRPHEFDLFCGPTGRGKTTWLANLAVHLALAGVPLFIAAVEVGKEDFILKMLSVLEGRDVSKLPREELLKLKKSHSAIFNNAMHVFTKYDSRVRHERILADMLAAHELYGTSFGLFDNLNFMMDVTRAQDAILTMDRAVHDFVTFHKKMPIHSIMVVHPKKTEHGRVESEFDIKGSSTAVQEASNVFLFNTLRNGTDVPDGCEADYCRELKFAKVRRNGRAVGGRIIYALAKDGERYEEKALK